MNDTVWARARKRMTFFLALCLLCHMPMSIFAASALAASAPAASTQGEDSSVLLLHNDLYEIGFSRENGAIIRLIDPVRGITYVDEAFDTPFRLALGNELSSAFSGFSADVAPDAQSARLTWTIDGGLTLRAQVRLTPGEPEAAFTFTLDNAGDAVPLAVEYPVIGRLGKIAEENYLAHSYVTGLLVKEPLKNFVSQADGLRFMPYPESFSGASMQFFTYYGQRKGGDNREGYGAGGLYCAALDDGYHQKWLNFYRMDQRLEASHMLGYEDVGAGKGIACDYPFVVRFIAGEGWYEAAQLYKDWATRQPWCAQGTAAQREGARADFLLSGVGLTTFGVNAMHDRTLWLKKYHDDIGAPIFHVLGPDWTNKPQTFFKGVPGGMDDWLPTRFSPENLALMRAQGDYFAPFEFDFLVATNMADSANLKANLELFPSKPLSHDAYNFAMLCPYTQFTKDFHRERDVQVYREAGVDGMYYDISANNLMKTCMSSEHGHAVGGGSEITLAYKELYADTKRALSEEAGKYMPLGTEMMCEVFLPELDYYQARAWAQPSSTLETWPFRNLMKSGDAEMIPLFDYVYHEYGAVRMDGWGKLVDKTGELFYNIVAKTYLWGGLYEINHEYSPMEAIDGVENKGEEHYFPFDSQGFAYSEDHARYLRQFTALRMGEGNEFLAYGTMKRPPDIGDTRANFKWFHYNHGQKDPSYRAGGMIKVPAVRASAYLAPGGASAAILLANTDDKPYDVAFALDGEALGLPGGAYTCTLMTDFDPARAPTARQLDIGNSRVQLSLAPRTVCMLRVDTQP